MNKFGKPDRLRVEHVEQLKVRRGFYNLLINHPLFKMQPEAINAARTWVNTIFAKQFANDGNHVTWAYKDIENRFRRFSGLAKYTEFRDALRDLELIKYSQYRQSTNESSDGESRKFAVTVKAWEMLALENYQRLISLIKDPKIRRRNQVAIAGRKKRRTAYSEPTQRIIDEFRHGVTFERSGILKQLRIDKNSRSLKVKPKTIAGIVEHLEDFSGPQRRFQESVHLILAFEERKFCDLILKDGKICHEFTLLYPHYRRFALFNDRFYMGFWGIKQFNPNFVGFLPCDLFPTLHAYSENFGLTLVYEPTGISLFAEPGAELQAKWDDVKAFIRQQLAEHIRP